TSEQDRFKISLGYATLIQGLNPYGSGRQSTIAVIRGLTASSRCSAESATSRADTLRVLTRRATSLAGKLQSSLIAGAPIQSHRRPRHRLRAASGITSTTTAGPECLSV